MQGPCQRNSRSCQQGETYSVHLDRNAVKAFQQCMAAVLRFHSSLFSRCDRPELLHLPSTFHTSRPLRMSAAAAAGASKAVLLYQYDQLVQGTLHKRYKRFLADVAFPDAANPASTSSITPNSNASAVDDTAQAGVGSSSPAGAPASKRRRRAASAAAAAASPSSTSSPAEAAAEADAAGGAAAAVTVVHCPNTGSMRGLLDQLPAACAASISASATRKYKHTLELICLQPGGSWAELQQQQQQPPVWVGVHSALANKLAAALLSKQVLPQLGQYEAVQAEVKLGGSSSTRFDFLLTRSNKQKVYVEVKSITMAMPYALWSSSKDSAAAAAAAASSGGSSKGSRCSSSSRKGGSGAGKKGSSTAAAAAVAAPAAAVAAAAVAAPAAAAQAVTAAAAVPADGVIALFPDAVSERAQRHVQDLTQLKASGHEAVCLFVIQRSDCCCFAPAAHVDPAYAAAVRAAHAAGVQMLAVVCEPDPATKGIWFKGCVPVLV